MLPDGRHGMYFRYAEAKGTRSPWKFRIRALGVFRIKVGDIYVISLVRWDALASDRWRAPGRGVLRYAIDRRIVVRTRFDGVICYGLQSVAVNCQGSC